MTSKKYCLGLLMIGMYFYAIDCATRFNPMNLKYKTLIAYSCHGTLREPGTRRRGASFKLIFLFTNTEIAGDTLSTQNDVKTGHRGRETQGL